jgi:hypothetical protein
MLQLRSGLGSLFPEDIDRPRRGNSADFSLGSYENASYERALVDGLTRFPPHRSNQVSSLPT